MSSEKREKRKAKSEKRYEAENHTRDICKLSTLIYKKYICTRYIFIFAWPRAISISGVHVEEQKIRNNANRTDYCHPNPNSNLNQRPLLGCCVWKDSRSLCSDLDSCAVL